MSYSIFFKESARKELLSIPVKMMNKISAAVDGLSLNPRPDGVKN